MPLECISKGLRASKAKFPHQPQSSQFVRTSFSLLWVPWSFPVPVTSFKHAFLKAEQSRGFLTGFRKKPSASDSDRNPLLNPNRQDPLLICSLHHPLQLYWVRACVWGGFLSVDPRLLGCSAQVIWRDMENAPPRLSAVLQLHGIFHCIWSPATFQTVITEPSHHPGNVG